MFVLYSPHSQLIDPSTLLLIDNISYDGMMAYDVADMLKQYFRELPEPLMTAKLSETFINIFTCKSSSKLSQLPHFFPYRFFCSFFNPTLLLG